MKLVICLCALSATLLAAEIENLASELNSEKFEARQAAEEKLIEWAQESEPEKRAEILFQRFLQSDDPEEFRRLTKILLAVHFEQKKDSIPQEGPGFIGISMAQQARLQFQRQGFEQGQLPEQFELKKGVFIDAVIAGTPAEKAGLKAGDIVTEINGESIAGDDPTGRLKEIVGGKPPGTKIGLTIEREKETLKKEVTLMNANAVPVIRRRGDQPRVDAERAAELLKQDYLRWLMEQRVAHQAL